jgi:hypothetical protein
LDASEKEITKLPNFVFKDKIEANKPVGLLSKIVLPKLFMIVLKIETSLL